MLRQEKKIQSNLWKVAIDFFSLSNASPGCCTWFYCYIRSLEIPTGGIHSYYRSSFGLRGLLYQFMLIAAWDTTGDNGTLGLCSING